MSIVLVFALKMDSRNPKNIKPVLFNKFEFMAARLLEVHDFFGSDFVIHARTFKHKPIASGAISRANELKLGEVPRGVIGVELTGFRHQAFGDFGGTAVVFFDVFKKIENGIAKLVSAHATIGNKKAASGETAYRGLIKSECRVEVNRGRWYVSA